jgi:thiol-disulfide isomerase/thioredoxin
MLAVRSGPSVVLLAGALVLGLSGCGPTSTQSKQDSEETAEPACCCCQTTPTAPAEEESCCGESEKAATTPVSADARETKPAAKVELKAVKYEKLGEAIRAHKGKVVVIDVWATWCIPCKKEFPHLVDLHRKYGPDGLVCVSVSVDLAKGETAALEFLRKQKATFPNYRLDEKEGAWADKFDLKAIPAVFVFNKAGKRAAKFTLDDPDNQFSYDKDVEPKVRELLKERN